MIRCRRPCTGRARNKGLPEGARGTDVLERLTGLALGNLLVVIPLAVVAGVLQATLFEWIYHRYWLHRPWLPPQMFTAHTLVHHQLCKHEDTFHVTEPEQEEALTFQWWGGPVLVAINLIPWAIAAWLARGTAYPGWIAMGVVGATIFVYYLAYEGFHHLMHKPAMPWIERAGFFQFIKKHHRLHHVYMGKNFNVVLPLADLFMGTLVIHDPHPPRPTEPAARVVARRHSAWGKRLRAEAAGVPERTPRPDPLVSPPES